MNGILEKGTGLLGTPLSSAIGGAVLGGTVVGATIGAVSAIKKRRKKSTKRKATKKRTTRKKATKKRKTLKKRTYKYARTAGKRRDRSTRRIRMTKYGQPYIILKSGKAKFISKKSARLSRKRKGGRY